MNASDTAAMEQIFRRLHIISGAAGAIASDNRAPAMARSHARIVLREAENVQTDLQRFTSGTFDDTESASIHD